MNNNYGYLNWFAWFPVRTIHGELVWLETVGRCLIVIKGISYYQYRKISRDPKNINFAI